MLAWRGDFSGLWRLLEMLDVNEIRGYAVKIMRRCRIPFVDEEDILY